MSEIKITKDSLENAILRDGQFVSGYVEKDNGHINASGYGAHAEGYSWVMSIDASGNGAHAEGIDTSALNDGTHAEGFQTVASGYGAHAEGGVTVASGVCAHAEGSITQAISDYSHAGGIGTIANQTAMTAIGKYNISANTKNTLFVVGDGSLTDFKRHNAFEVIENSSYSTRATVNGISDVYLGCPVGTIVMWPGETVPEGWLLCNGKGIDFTSNTSTNININYTYDGNYYHIKNEEDEKYYLLIDILAGNTKNLTNWKWGSIISSSGFKGILLPNFQKRFPLGALQGGTIGINNKVKSGWSTNIGNGS